jgi:hypothetical protein
MKEERNNIEMLVKRQEEEEHLSELKKIYFDYVDLVDTVARGMFCEVDKKANRINYEVTLQNDLNYLKYFEKYLEDVSVDIEGPLDSFVEAACLMFALIDSKRVSFNTNKKNIPQNLLELNYSIALTVASNLISESSFYVEIKKDALVSILLGETITIPYVSLDVSLIDTLPIKIIDTLMLNDVKGNRNDPILFSLFLQSLYFESVS